MYESVYNPNTDPQILGKADGALRRAFCGGSWPDYTIADYPGSRCIHMEAFTTSMMGNCTIRGCNTTYYYPGAVWNQSSADPYILDGYSWNDISVYNYSIDSQSYGGSWGLYRRFIFGCAYVDSFRCGSRSGASNWFTSKIHQFVSTRGCKKNDPFAIILGRVFQTLIHLNGQI